jgi:heme/copper-type cytochrome/quinol oxidase subunit 2
MLISALVVSSKSINTFDAGTAIPIKIMIGTTVNMTEGVTSVSHDIYGLHMMVFWVSVAIAIVVFGAMFYSLYTHRKSKGAVAANFHESTKAELVWTVVWGNHTAISTDDL